MLPAISCPTPPDLSSLTPEGFSPIVGRIYIYRPRQGKLMEKKFADIVKATQQTTNE